MQAFTRGLLAPALLVGLATSAPAAVVPFTGAITLEFDLHPPVSLPGSGLMTINASGPLSGPVTHLSLPPAVFATATTLPVVNAFPFVHLRVVASNAAVASFGPAGAPCGTPHPNVSCSGSGSLHGRSGLVGSALMGLFGTAGSPGVPLSLPLAVAGGGSTFMIGHNEFTARGSGAGWTTGTATVFNGAMMTTRTRMGGQTVTTGGAYGRIVLVSPLNVRMFWVGYHLPSFATWELNYALPVVPEPGTLLLLVSGALALVLHGRSRMRISPRRPR